MKHTWFTYGGEGGKEFREKEWRRGKEEGEEKESGRELAGER